MGDSDRFMVALRDAAVPMCDDCITLAVGWMQRQRANMVGRKLANVGDIRRANGTCARCGRVKTVSWIGDTQ
jgi:hypothetical protein